MTNNAKLQKELYGYLDKLQVVQDRIEKIAGHDVLKARLQAQLTSLQQTMTDAVIVLQE